MNYKVIQVSPQGYCGGVLQAIANAKKTRIQFPDQRITILGNLVHNEYVKKALALENIETIEDSTKTRLELLEDIQEGIVIFTAHGVSPVVKQRAIEKGLTVIDASCPFVLQTQKIVHQKLDDGYTIFYIGKYKHPEAEAIYSSHENVYLIQNIHDIPDIECDKIFVTNQTTMSIFDIRSIFKAIKEKYPHAKFHDEICNATRVRQQAILNLKEQQVDALIVVGSPTSNNTKKLAEIGTQANIPIVLRIQDINDLNIEDLKDAQTIAVTSGASTPTYLTLQVVNYLKNYPTKKEKIRIDQIL